MAEFVHVRDWPMETYPYRDAHTQEPLTNVFKIVIENPDGSLGFKTIHVRDNGEEVRQFKYELLTTDKTLPPKGKVKENWPGMRADIQPDDLRAMEESIGGKPSSVCIGLWAIWDGVMWKKMDMEKTNFPTHFYNITDRYYKDMRPKAYKEAHDPFANMQRPYTDVLLKEQELERLKKELAEAQATNARLSAKVGN